MASERNSVQADAVKDIASKMQKGMGTKEIMVMLYKLKQDAVEIPNNNPILAQCIIIDKQTAQKQAALRSLPDMGQMTNPTKIAIDKLKGAPATKNAGNELEKEFEAIQANIQSIHLEKDEKAQFWSKLIKENQATVISIIQQVKEAIKENKNPASITIDPTIKKSIADVSISLKATGAEIDSFAGKMEDGKRKLNRLYSQAYSVVSPGERTGLEPPRLG